MGQTEPRAVTYKDPYEMMWVRERMGGYWGKSASAAHSNPTLEPLHPIPWQIEVTEWGEQLQPKAFQTEH